MTESTWVGHRYVDVVSGATIDSWFPREGVAARRSCLAEKFGLIKGEPVEVATGKLHDPPESTEQAYLRLHLLSMRIAQPNTVSLDNLFTLLPINAWTSAGPVPASRLDELRSAVAAEHHHVTVFSVDRFPRMADYVVPTGVRIAAAERVRLGAHLAYGTTVMHEGFVNFNAGSVGESMIEGRVSSGVIVGRNSDIGGGASVMGSLSGGGSLRNSIGEKCLLGANSGLGIPLGDSCTVEAGLYITAGTKVSLEDGTVVRARELAGRSGLLFRRNSQTGAVEALSSANVRWKGLTAPLHTNSA